MQTTQHAYGEAKTITRTPVAGVPVEPVPATIHARAEAYPVKIQPQARRGKHAGGHTQPEGAKAAARKRGKVQRASRRANRQ